MPYGTISSNSISYAPRSVGVYAKSTLGLADPPNEFRITGNARSKSIRSFAVTRVVGKDDSTSGKRYLLIATLNVQLPREAKDFTESDIDGIVADISTFVTTDTIIRMLSGEQ